MEAVAAATGTAAVICTAAVVLADPREIVCLILSGETPLAYFSRRQIDGGGYFDFRSVCPFGTNSSYKDYYVIDSTQKLMDDE